MKRRVFAAVLFVLALAALVLIGCGGAKRQDAETIKGKPVTGGSPVTRSVAWIEGHRNLQPEPASLPGPDPDAEAAAESVAAKLEPGEESVREKPEPGEEGGPPKSAGR